MFFFFNEDKDNVDNMKETDYSVGDIGYIEINKLMRKNAIRIYQHWKQLESEIRAISTRGVNFPCELSEQFACFVLGYYWNKSGQGDAYDKKTDRVIEIKGSSKEGDDVSSFSPSEKFDELVFVKIDKNDDAVYIYLTGVDSHELGEIQISKKQKVKDQQRQKRRPRFSIEKKIIRAKGLAPDYKLDLLTQDITILNKND